MATVVQNERITGSALGFSIGGTEFWADCTSVQFEPGDADPLTFGDVAAGASGAWSVKGGAIMSTAPGSLWRHIWDNVGKEVDLVLAPHGNKTATGGQPHFTAKARIKSRPPIGTEVGKKEGMVFEFEWPLTTEPVLKTT